MGQKLIVDKGTLSDIANAIREKTGSSDLMEVQSMAEAIRGIPAGDDMTLLQFQSSIDGYAYAIIFTFMGPKSLVGTYQVNSHPEAASPVLNAIKKNIKYPCVPVPISNPTAHLGPVTLYVEFKDTELILTLLNGFLDDPIAYCVKTEEFHVPYDTLPNMNTIYIVDTVVR